MRSIQSVILSSGGMRSLVAASTLGREGLAWLYVHDGRIAGEHFREMFVRQAEHYDAVFRSELKLSHLFRETGGEDQPGPMARFQLLTGAASEAIRMGATRLIWPVTAGEDFDLVSRITETLVLLEHVIKLETGAELAIETPLLDLTPRQVIEVGEQQDVPWRLSRSCVSNQAKPCGACVGCLQRGQAFGEARVIDPLMQAAPTREV